MRDRRVASAQPRARTRGWGSCSPGCCARWATAAATRRASPSTATRPGRRPGTGASRCSTSDDAADDVAAVSRRDCGHARSTVTRIGDDAICCPPTVDAEALLAAARDGVSRRAGRRIRRATSPCSRVSATRATLTDAWGLAGAPGLAGRRAHPDGHRVGGDTVGLPTPTPSGPRQCLVHNGSFANHATIRRELRRRRRAVRQRERHRGGRPVRRASSWPTAATSSPR